MKKLSRKAGLPPGTAVLIADQSHETRIHMIDYSAAEITEKEINDPSECAAFMEKKSVTWINVYGLADQEKLGKLCDVFGLHPLVIEDIMNTDQRPKTDDYEGYIFTVMKMLYRDEKASAKSEQISLILGRNFVISFQEREGDVFNPVRERIRGGKGRIRKMGADYLHYSLIDAVVDNYFIILETIGDKIELLEDELIASPGPKTLRILHSMKREMITLRKSVWPLREVVYAHERSEAAGALISKPTRIFYRDVYDHTIQVIDTVETYRDILSGMLDIYLSSVSNRLNEVMKLLTIFGTIFLPLTFLSGLYGMNFRYMPELEHPFGYPAILLLMAATAAAMLMYFRKKKWI